MNHRSGPQALRRSLSLLVASIGIATSFGATADSPALRVVIHGDHYAFDGNRFDRLASLETAVHAAPRWIELDACGPNAARTLKAASYRFSELPQRLRVLDASNPACAATTRTGHDIGVASEAIDDARVEAYWRQRMP